MASSITHTGVGQVSNTNGLGYGFSFATLNREDIQVEIIDPSNNKTTKTVTTHYTIENYLEAGSSNAHIKFVSETARGFTNSQTTYKVRIKRQTPTAPKVNFIAGSSITASDLNTHGKQAFHLSEENRDSINSLAAGDATGAVQISGSNIANNSITTDKILDLEVKSADISSSSSNDSLRAITTDHIRDGAVTDAKINGVSGSKVTPDFGSQNIVTTGTLSSGDMTISDNSPRILFTELNADPDYKLISEGGKFIIREETNQADRLVVNTDGHVDVTGNLDVGAGADVTGNLTVTGDATFNNGISTNGRDVYTANAAFISSDTSGHFADRSNSNNVDHIWHDETNNEWNFCSDTGYKSAGNSKVRAGEFHGDGSNLTNLLIGVKQVKEDSSTGTSSRTSSSYATKASVSLTNTASTSRVLVISTYKIWGSTPYSAGTTSARTTRGNDSTFSGDTYDTYSNSGGSSSQYSPSHTSFLWDVSTSSGTREYKIRYNRSGSGTGYISDARIMAIEFRPT